jgi:hypothetical protein
MGIYNSKLKWIITQENKKHEHANLHKMLRKGLEP